MRVAKLGLGPVRAALLPNAARIFIANETVFVSSYLPTDVAPRDHRQLAGFRCAGVRAAT
jgi:hypothetical protein